MAKPLGERNGCVWLTPSSMIPIFIPLPAVVRFGPQSVGRADQLRGLVRAWTRSRRASGSARRDRPGRLRAASRAAGPRNSAARPRARSGRCCSASARSRPAARSRSGSAASAAPPPGCGGSPRWSVCAGRASWRAPRPRQRAAVKRRLRQRRRVSVDDDLGARRARGGRSGNRERREARREEQDPVSGGKWYRRYT